jgi:hypothetical protein
MSEPSGWGFKNFTRLIKIFTREEVKTPLSFLFKIVPYLIGALIIILYAPIGDGLKERLVKWTFWALLSLSSAVLLFGWFKPKNLVYGETGHRAERKMEYGTEKKTVAQGELDELESVEGGTTLLLK